MGKKLLALLVPALITIGSTGSVLAADASAEVVVRQVVVKDLLGGRFASEQKKLLVAALEGGGYPGQHVTLGEFLCERALGTWYCDVQVKVVNDYEPERGPVHHRLRVRIARGDVMSATMEVEP